MPLSPDEERELARLVLLLGDFDGGVSLTLLRRRARALRARWRRLGWLDARGRMTEAGRQGLTALLRGRGGA
jgi:hypothetical protein